MSVFLQPQTSKTALLPEQLILSNRTTSQSPQTMDGTDKRRLFKATNSPVRHLHPQAQILPGHFKLHGQGKQRKEKALLLVKRNKANQVSLKFKDKKKEDVMGKKNE